jgi:hypothetical protein
MKEDDIYLAYTWCSSAKVQEDRDLVYTWCSSAKVQATEMNMEQGPTVLW